MRGKWLQILREAKNLRETDETDRWRENGAVQHEKEVRRERKR
jgi:hypothetical protein